MSVSTELILILRTTPHTHIRLLTLNRVAKRNALSNELIVASACRDAALDPDVHHLVISGGDTFFSVGADIKEMQQRGFGTIDNTDRRSSWNDISKFPKPLNV